MNRSCKHRIFAFLLTFTLMLAVIPLTAAAKEDSDVQALGTSSVVLNLSSLSLQVDEEETLIATAVPSDAALVWSSK